MRSTKEGNDFSALMVDACISLSLLLQHGMSMADLVKAFGASGDVPQSALGAIAWVGADLDLRAETCKAGET